MKNFVFVVGFIIMHASAFAAGKDDISQRMHDYWGTYSGGEFGKAAEAMTPAAALLAEIDLENALLPEQEALQHLLAAEAVFNDINVSRQSGRGGGAPGRPLPQAASGCNGSPAHIRCSVHLPLSRQGSRLGGHADGSSSGLRPPSLDS